MTYVILLNLQVILLFVYPVIECFKKRFMHHLAMSSIVVYYTTIISNILNKVVNCMKFRIVKDWFAKFRVN